MKKKVMFSLVLVLFFLVGTASLSHALEVYVAAGKGAETILDKPNYQDVFRSIFSAHKLTLDLTSTRASFLANMYKSDIVYLSLHSNPRVLVVGNGDRVEIADLARATKAASKLPSLIIVTGCTTIDLKTKTNIPAALGIKPGTPKRAYIGFKTITLGLFADRYFRVFLAAWMKPIPGGGYRTLDEARDYAADFINRMISRQGSATGEIARFAPLDAKVAGWFVIIGDNNLRFSDL